jgi:hypothetical protein
MFLQDGEDVGKASKRGARSERASEDRVNYREWVRDERIEKTGVHIIEREEVGGTERS